MIGMTVCSGIGAPELAAPWIGWRYQSEIEKFPSAVLATHFPDARNLGDMTKFKEWPDADIDVLCGGTPCQSFSIAGLRKGLADPRGNLALTYLAIAERYRPRWLVWENVPGVLSALSHDSPDQRPPEINLDGDNGPRDGEEVVVTDRYDAYENHALWCFVAGAAELGYHGGFRTFDAQYVRTRGFPRAVPQRRRRVFFVGYLGDWRRAAAVLFDRESLRGDPPPRRETGQGPAPTISARPSGGGGLGTDFDCNGELTANSGDVSHCITASGQQSLDAETETLIAANTLIGKGNDCHAADLQTYVAHTLKGEGFDASEDGTGRGTPIVPVAFDCKGTEVQTAEDGTAPTLRCMGHNSSHQNAGGHAAIAIQGRAVSENPNAGPGAPDDVSPPLSADADRGDQEAVVAVSGPLTASMSKSASRLPSEQGALLPIAFSAKDYGNDAREGVAPTVDAGTAYAVAFDKTQITSPRNYSNPCSGDPVHPLAAGAHPPAVAFDLRGREGGAMPEGPHDTANLRASEGGSSRSYIAQPWAVRRLTPKECERLMGFHDGWTAIPWRGKPADQCPDGPRYKALGNSWAVNCGVWLFDRIRMVEAMP